MPTKQETFDTVVNHLREQGRKASDNHGFCEYRTDDGLKCAAGCLILDDDITPEILQCGSVHVNGGNVVSDYLKDRGHDLELVRQLQLVHDKCRVKDWEKNLKFVAENYSLTFTSP